jgi:hypothetical protein
VHRQQRHTQCTLPSFSRSALLLLSLLLSLLLLLLLLYLQLH